MSPALILAIVVTLCLFALSSPAGAMENDAAAQSRPRLIVLTDISSLRADQREPDDGQSMIRLMLYTNELDVEGLIASSNLGHGQTVRPELIREVIEAYGKARPNLLLHDPGYPPTEQLIECVKGGQPLAGPKTRVQDSVGDGKDTEGSDWIIRVVDRDDPRPVWVSVWGGSADLAQAFWHVRKKRDAEALAKFVSKLRVSLIGDQDSTGPWMKDQFPDLWCITHGFSIRGMYRGGDASLSSAKWVEENVRKGHGALGALYPNYNGGDIFSSRLGQVRGIKEGDTPSFLRLMANGLSDPEHPERRSWGGRFKRAAGGDPKPPKSNRFVDAQDDVGDRAEDPHPAMSAVYRWRSAYQADFAARMDWCVKSYDEANHPPRPNMTGMPSDGKVAAGATFTLDASGSVDPDDDKLSYAWLTDAEPTGPDAAVIRASESTATITVPAVASKQPLHIIVAVRDDGEPALTRYRRVTLTVIPR